MNSHMQLQTRNGVNVNYQIASIICHEGKSSGEGHYVTYIRNDGNWWLYNDAISTSILDIERAVDCCEVVLCFYVQVDKVKDELTESLIGEIQRRGARSNEEVPMNSQKRPRIT